MAFRTFGFIRGCIVHRPSLVNQPNLWRLSSTSTSLSSQPEVDDVKSTDDQQISSTSVTNPLEHDDYFKVKNTTSIRELYKARVHFGHTKGNRNVYMKPYLYGCRMGIDIIDLNKTLTHMQLALNFLAHMAYRRAVILFILQSSQYGHHVEKAAIACGEYSHTRQWKIGLFTNKRFGEKTRYPDVCVFLSTKTGSQQPQHPAIGECAKMGIATVGIVDTNVNPTIITYPIPGNDDTLESIEHYLHLFKGAITAGKMRREIDDMRMNQLKQQEKEKQVQQEKEEQANMSIEEIFS